MRVLATALLLAAIVTFGPSAYGAGKITVDPNSGPRQTVPETDVGSMDLDGCLSQKVTYRAKHVPLKTILADLSKTTSVALKSGSSTQDWQVRDRRMCVFVKDVTLRDLMRSIARTMHFKWSVGELGGHPSYRLILDRKSLMELNKRLRQAEEDLGDKVKENRQKLLNAALSMDNISAPDLEKLKESNPYLYALESTGGGELIRLLNKEIPEAIDALLNGTNYYAMATELSPAVQQALIGAARGYRRIFENRGYGKQEYLDNIESNISSAWLRVRGQSDGSPEQKLRDLGSVIIKLGPKYKGDAAFLLARLRPPDSVYDQKVAALYFESKGDELQARKLIEQAKADLAPATKELEEEALKLCPGDPPVEHSDEEWMHTKADMTKCKSKKLRDVFEALADASGLSVVADSYVLTEQAPGFVQGATRGELLKKIADCCNYNWDKHESTLELTDRYWIYKRDLQIPAEWVECWSNNTRRNKSLSFDDYVQIASLTDEQLEENLTEDEVLGSYQVYQGINQNLNETGASRPLARLYGVLGGEQRKLLWNSFGLPLQMLTPEQSKYAQAAIEIFTDWGPASAWVQSPDVRFRGSLTTDREKGDKCTLSIVPGDNAHSLDANYVMPVYQQPQPSAAPVSSK